MNIGRGPPPALHLVHTGLHFLLFLRSSCFIIFLGLESLSQSLSHIELRVGDSVINQYPVCADFGITPTLAEQSRTV